MFQGVLPILRWVLKGVDGTVPHFRWQDMSRVRKGLESPKSQKDASVSGGMLAFLPCPVLHRDFQLRTQTSRKYLSSSLPLSLV